MPKIKKDSNIVNLFSDNNKNPKIEILTTNKDKVFTSINKKLSKLNKLDKVVALLQEQNKNFSSVSNKSISTNKFKEDTYIPINHKNDNGMTYANKKSPSFVGSLLSEHFKNTIGTSEVPEKIGVHHVAAYGAVNALKGIKTIFGEVPFADIFTEKIQGLMSKYEEHKRNSIGIGESFVESNNIEKNLDQERIQDESLNQLQDVNKNLKTLIETKAIPLGDKDSSNTKIDDIGKNIEKGGVKAIKKPFSLGGIFKDLKGFKNIFSLVKGVKSLKGLLSLGKILTGGAGLAGAGMEAGGEALAGTAATTGLAVGGEVAAGAGLETAGAAFDASGIGLPVGIALGLAGLVTIFHKQIGNMISDSYNFIAHNKTISRDLHSISQEISNVYSGIVKSVEAFPKKFKDFFSSIFKDISKDISKGFDFLKNIGKNVIDDVTTAAKSTYQGAKNIINDVVGGPNAWNKVNVGQKLNKQSFSRFLANQRIMESSNNPNAVSNMGAVGIAQFEPGTWNDLWKKHKDLNWWKTNLGNSKEGLQEYQEVLKWKKNHGNEIPQAMGEKTVGLQEAAQRAYMQELTNKYHSRKWALAAYNMGEGGIANAYKQYGNQGDAGFVKATKYSGVGNSQTRGYIQEAIYLQNQENLKIAKLKDKNKENYANSNNIKLANNLNTTKKTNIKEKPVVHNHIYAANQNKDSKQSTYDTMNIVSSPIGFYDYINYKYYLAAGG